MRQLETMRLVKRGKPLLRPAVLSGLLLTLLGCSPQTAAPAVAVPGSERYVGMTLDRFNADEKRTPQSSFENGHGKTFLFADPSYLDCRVSVETDRISEDRRPSS